MAQSRSIVGVVGHDNYYADNTIGNNNAGFHNSLYRGKSLGTAVTSTQWSQISAGTFNDMFIGDYWTIQSRVWRIAAFDYWFNYGDQNCQTHHIVIVPDANIGSNQPMRSDGTTTGGYMGSDFYTGENNNTAKQVLVDAISGTSGAFYNHVLSHREYLTNAVTNGYASGGTWTDSTIELMSEEMVYGTIEYKNVTNGTNVPGQYTVDHGQLPLFAINHAHICNRAYWWLRDVASASNFAIVYNHGRCSYYSASYTSIGFRPAFGIRA